MSAPESASFMTAEQTPAAPPAGPVIEPAMVKLLEHMRGYTHTAGINILGEGLPYEHNLLELSSELDARGLPKPRIHYSNGENEKKMHTHAEKLMRDMERDYFMTPKAAHEYGLIDEVVEIMPKMLTEGLKEL